MSKSIKQIAEELGFSKTYIMQTIKNNGLQNSLLKNGNKFLVDDNLELKIKDLLGFDSKTENENSSQTVGGEHLADLRRQISLLESQLKEKDEQIRAKDFQISEKDKQLDQQQQLTLKAMADKEVLKLELEATRTLVEESQKSRGFWARFFGR